jgi:hypothetical protein
MKPRYLTKSRFKLALECPAKLYYDGKPEYANQKTDDPFLLELARGGFQVGALARCYFPGGKEIYSHDYDEAVAQTNALLKNERAVIFEAAVRFQQLFIRVDILIKNKNRLELVEVKAKSFDSASGNNFITGKGTISSEWFPYLADVAFQKYVTAAAFPNYAVSADLMLVDKNAVCPTHGLNQKFKIVKDQHGNKSISVSPDLTQEDLSTWLLKRVDVDDCCEVIYNQPFGSDVAPLSFVEYVDLLADKYTRDQKISVAPRVECASCEFRTTPEDETAGLKSGYRECWKEYLGWTDEEFMEPTVLDLWNYRKKESCLKAGRIKLCDITELDISPLTDNKPGLSRTQRQWLQVQKARSRDHSYWLDARNLKNEMDRWVFPLHFIDFETSMVAIPFNKGRHPYEGIAFQFSHHVVHRDGRVEHRGQYLNVMPGVFPNYAFLRCLKSELEQDNGSIFRYAAHENSYLNCIYWQLKENQDDVSDWDGLCQFIRSITQSARNATEQWTGERNMIDMLELVKRYYYDPGTNGSNSIKQVLPAILKSSKFLQEKYARPIYGARGGIPSLNYRDWQWIKIENGHITDPYTLLPRMFQDIPDKTLELLSEDDELKDGGAALAAYARLQFEDMSEYERSEIRNALLKYCELDTLAMVMLYEGWKDLINQA